jgi:phage terminase large subunit
MPTVQINRKLEPLLTKHKPIKIAVGGRGSGKSLGVGDIMTIKMATEKADIYCLREFQDSIADSVHKVFKGSIEDRLKLPGWDIQENKIVAPNGARTVYKGANRNPDAMQSAQGFKYSWFEEAHRASQSSIDKLLPTIIRNTGAECWFTANPQSSADPFSKRFIVPYQHELYANGIYEDDLHLIVLVNWRDNPWWNDEQEKLRIWDYENQDRAHYDWIWEGKFNDTIDNSIIKPEWFDAAIDAHKKLGFETIGQKVAAFDPADEGGDSKAYTLRHGSVILDIDEYTKGDSIDGLNWAVDKAIQAQADLFIWDCDGIGSGMKESITRMFNGKLTKLEMFKGSESPDNPDGIYNDYLADVKGQKSNRQTFKNNRACRYWKLRDRFYNTYQAVEKGKYIDPEKLISISSTIPKIQSIRAEVCRLPRVYGGNGLIQMMSKPDMMKKGIKSPNMSDSLMMTMTDFKKLTVERLNFKSGW